MRTEARPANPDDRFGWSRGALAAVSAICLLLALALAFRSDQLMKERPFIEDAYYSLSVARTLGGGGGISVDGINLTNGVQPLICFIYAPAFAVSNGDDLVALRIVVIISALIFGVAALSVGWFTAAVAGESPYRRVFFWLGTAFTIGSYAVSVQALNGLETGLAIAFTFGIAAFYTERIAGRSEVPLAELVRCGALLGIGILVRIDLAFLSAALGIAYLIQAVRSGALGRGVPGMLAIGVTSVLVSLPWWLYNAVVFGHIIPISGLAQQDLWVDRWISALLSAKALSNAFLLTLHLPSAMLGAEALAGVIGAAVVAAAFALTRVGRALMSRVRDAYRGFRLGGLAPLTLHLLILVVYYTFFFGAPHFAERYLVGGRLLLALGVVVTLFVMADVTLSRLLRAIPAVILALSLVAGIGAFSRNFVSSPDVANIHLAVASWITENTLPTERVAMFQSGTTSFYAPNVTNLDGKVNPAALRAMLSGTLPALVDSVGYEYIIDWDVYTRQVFVDPAVRSQFTPIDTLPNNFVVWKRRSDVAAIR